MAPVMTCRACAEHTESTFRVDGMDCHEEVAILNRVLTRVPGVEALMADVVGQRLRVAYDRAVVSPVVISEAVATTGMRAWVEQDASPGRQEPSMVWRHVLVGISGVFIALGAALSLIETSPLWSPMAFALAIVSGGVHTVRRALVSARALSFDINVLMVIAVIGALAIGEWFEAAAVVFLFAVAQLLEARSLDRARRALRTLVHLSPDEALVRRGGQDIRVAADEVAVGDVVIVKPGDRIPLDGDIVAGESDVNQATITGESQPVPKTVGAQVFAGTMNGSGVLEVRVTHLKRDSMLARIVHLVERAHAQRAPAQAFVDRFATYYTPAVLLLALAVATLPPLVAGAPFGSWFYRSLVLLVISCPCALVISTPVSIVSGLTAAAHHGVLVKGGVHLERLGTMAAVAFDKTGTLTRGEPSVTDVIPLDGRPPEAVLALAAAVESRSTHPVGRAIAREGWARGLTIEKSTDMRAMPGLGAEAVVNGRRVTVGNAKLCAQRGIMTADADRTVAERAALGQSTVLVGEEGSLVGIIALADRLRIGAHEAVARLRDEGVKHVTLLSGDNASSVQAIAAEAGVDDFQPELLPEKKVDAVKALRVRYGSVAMVGDGVNDAPALAAADVGIAMGAAGSDTALETADVALMADDLVKLPYAFRLSRATLRNIKVNVAFALGLKLVFLILAVMGVATLWMAVVADTGASLLVIANALRLLKT